MKKRPPIGIMPRHVWLEFLEGPEPSEDEKRDRRADLRNAINRYQKAGIAVPMKWIIEYAGY